MNGIWLNRCMQLLIFSNDSILQIFQIHLVCKSTINWLPEGAGGRGEALRYIYAAPGQGPAARRGNCFSGLILTRITRRESPPIPGPFASAAEVLKIGLFGCVLSEVQHGAFWTSKVVPKGSQGGP